MRDENIFFFDGYEKGIKIGSGHAFSLCSAIVAAVVAAGFIIATDPFDIFD